MTSTDVATTSGDLTIRPGQTRFEDAQIAALRHIGADKASMADLDVFFHQCQRTGLDPFLRQIHLVNYGGPKNPKWTTQVGIDGFRLIARRAATTAGEQVEYEDTQWCGPDGVWVDVWVSDDPPVAARAAVLRNGMRFPAVALYREYVGQRKVYDGPQGQREWTGGWEVNDQWTKRPAHMTAKCAEAAALRKAFPADMSGLYTPEELGERPDTVHGQVVRDDGAAAVAGGLVDALDLVRSASTRDELVAIWDRFAPVLPIAERAQLQHACQQAVNALPTQQEPPSAPEHPDPAPGPAAPQLDALLALCEQVGYRGDDQLRLAGALLGMDVPRWEDMPAADVARLVDRLTEVAGSPDPQAAIEALIAHAEA